MVLADRQPQRGGSARLVRRLRSAPLSLGEQGRGAENESGPRASNAAMPLEKLASISLIFIESLLPWFVFSSDMTTLVKTKTGVYHAYK